MAEGGGSDGDGEDVGPEAVPGPGSRQPLSPTQGEDRRRNSKEAPRSATAPSASSAVPPSSGTAEDKDSDWSDIDTDEEGDGDKATAASGRLHIDLGTAGDSELQQVEDRPQSSSAGDHPGIFAAPGLIRTKPSSSNDRRNKSSSASTYKGKRSGRARKQPVSIPRDVMDAVMGAKGATFNARIDCAAKKMRLNRTQVKTMIRLLVESPDLMNLIRMKAGEATGPAAKIQEPRITRKLARTVVESGGKLNWFLEKVAQTPAKNVPESIALIEGDFPEDEDDQEYDPRKDAVKGATSDDEDSSVATGSETCGTPLSTRWGGLNSGTFGTPGRDRRPGEDLQPLWDGGPFAEPGPAATVHGDGFLAPSQPFNRAVRMLNFDESGAPEEKRRVTRSKASLKELTIEELDSRFVPPDITPDMYDVAEELDDYAVFLAETFGQPLRPAAEEDGPEAVPEDDPDFVYHDADLLDEKLDEFKNNRSTKIPQKEVDALMQELFDAYEIEKEAAGGQGSRQGRSARPSKANGTGDLLEVGEPANWSNPEEVMTADQRLMLAQHMRQHIQLLTQMSLLTSKNVALQHLNAECGEMLSDIVGRSFQVGFSLFAQDNLFPSLKMIEEWNQVPDPVLKPSRKRPEFTKKFMAFVAEQPFLLYSELLPSPGSCGGSADKVTVWSTGEDELLVLALEDGGDATRVDVFRKLSKDLIRSKTFKQIVCRFKNQIAKETSVAGHYRLHKKLQRTQPHHILAPYDLSNIVPPKSRDPDSLPQPWSDFVWFQKGGRAIAREHAVQPKAAPPEPRKSVMVVSKQLPEGQTLSSLRAAAILNSKIDASKGPSNPVKILARPSPGKPLPDPDDSRVGGEPEVVRAAVPDEFKDRGGDAASATPGPDSADSSLSLMEVVVPIDDPPQEADIGASEDQPPPQDMILDHVQEMVPEDDDDVPPAHPPDAAQISGPTGAAAASPQGPDQAPGPAKKGRKPPGHQAAFETQQSATIGSKRLARQQHKVEETTAHLLRPEDPEERRQRREREAAEIIAAARSALPQDVLLKFCEVCYRCRHDSLQCFVQMHEVCAGYPDLQEMLLDLLEPEEAGRLGDLVYRQYRARQDLRQIYRKFRLLYGVQHCQAYSRALKELRAVMTDPAAGKVQVMAVAAKVFKSNQHLIDEFSSLWPDSEVCFSHVAMGSVEAEDVDLSDEEGRHPQGHQQQQEVAADYLFCEQVREGAIPETDLEKLLGTERCPCSCHLDKPLHVHCFHCSIKFVNGKLHIRDGKVLKPVKVNYPEGKEPPTSFFPDNLKTKQQPKNIRSRETQTKDSRKSK